MLDTLNQQGATILMVTHSHEHASRAHRIVNMVDGRVLPGVQPKSAASASVASHA
jgi:putative ABC transport system ATP-binding protein